MTVCQMDILISEEGKTVLVEGRVLKLLRDVVKAQEPVGHLDDNSGKP